MWHSPVGPPPYGHTSIGLSAKTYVHLLNADTRYYLPTPPLGQDMTQGQFLSGV